MTTTSKTESFFTLFLLRKIGGADSPSLYTYSFVCTEYLPPYHDHLYAVATRAEDRTTREGAMKRTTCSV